MFHYLINKVKNFTNIAQQSPLKNSNKVMNTNQQNTNFDEMVAGTVAISNRANGKQTLNTEQASHLIQANTLSHQHQTKTSHETSHRLPKQLIPFFADLPNADASIYPYAPSQLKTSNTAVSITNGQEVSPLNPLPQHTNPKTPQSALPQSSLTHQVHGLDATKPPSKLQFALRVAAFSRHSLTSLFTKILTKD